jgi:hypothetical protein
MTGDAVAGDRLMRERLPHWSVDSIAVTHCWWHWALFHLARGDIAAVLGIHDRQLRGPRSLELPDIIDASSLLWRLELLDLDTGGRWPELARAWAARVDDGYCSFSDVHAMAALVGAEDWKQAARLESRLLRSRMLATRYGETTRLIGLPVCRALMAFGKKHYARSVELLSGVSSLAGRMGGSQAQLDLLYLTLLEAVRRLRRPYRAAA